MNYENPCLSSAKYSDKKKLSETKKNESQTESSESDDSDEMFDLEELQQKTNFKKPPRKSITAEAYGVFNKKATFVLKVIPKTLSEKQGIRKILVNSFLFSSLAEDDLVNVIDALENRRSKWTCK